jgi:hypothetical protein
MMTYRLWTLLATPPKRHPLYKRATLLRSMPGWFRMVRHYFSSIAPILYLFGGMLTCCAMTSPTTGSTVLGLVAGVVLFNGTFYGMIWGILIANQIAAEGESGEWELLCTLPTGALGAAWATATGCMSRERGFENRHVWQVTIVRGGFLLAAVVGLGMLFNPATIPLDTIIVPFTAYFAALALSYVDYVQSVVLGSLTGIYAGIGTRSRFDAQLWGFIIFLALQVASYAGALIVGFVIAPVLLPSDSLSAQFARLAIQVAAFAGVREIALHGMWHLLAARLNADEGQLDTLVEHDTNGRHRRPDAKNGVPTVRQAM